MFLFLLKKAFLEFCKFFRAKPFGWLQKEPKNATFIAFFNDLLVISISPSFIYASHICSNKRAPKRINLGGIISSICRAFTGLVLHAQTIILMIRDVLLNTRQMKDMSLFKRVDKPIVWQ